MASKEIQIEPESAKDDKDCSLICAQKGNCCDKDKVADKKIQTNNKNESISDKKMQSKEGKRRTIFQALRSRVKCFVWFVRIILFLSVLTCLVLSKITFMKIVTDLYILSNYGNVSDYQLQYPSQQHAASLYWMIFFIIMVPNSITWIRGLFNGLLSRSVLRPWPKQYSWRCILLAVIEGATESVLIFYSFTSLNPLVSVILMCGVYEFSSVRYIIKFFTEKCMKQNHASCYTISQNSNGSEKCMEQNHTKCDTISHHSHGSEKCMEKNLTKCDTISHHSHGSEKCMEKNHTKCDTISHHSHGSEKCMEKNLTKCDTKSQNSSSSEKKKERKEQAISWIEWIASHLIGNTLKLGIILIPLQLATTENNTTIQIAITSICLIALSLIWSEKLQDSTFSVSENSENKAKEKLMASKVKGRWKASFLAASFRSVTCFLASFLIFSFSYTFPNGDNINPFSHSIYWNKTDLAVFITHAIASFLAYVLSSLSCYMTLHIFGLALPVLLATPLSLATYVILMTSGTFSFSQDLVFSNSKEVHIIWYLVLISGAFLWICQQILNIKLFIMQNAILASDESMFVRPYYNSILLEQSLAINRLVSDEDQRESNEKQNSFKVYVCSTMFRENEKEMKQMLNSIKRLVDLNDKNPEKTNSQSPKINDQFESHIFFDGGCRENEFYPFAIQLLSLVNPIFEVELDEAEKEKTPYGYRFKWFIGKNIKMPFTVHFKDNLKVRNKKRWSQVMYMKYIIMHLCKDKQKELDNTFILTTDGDVGFKGESAVVLLDMLARDPQVGAVCSRTHPQGNGPMYWYQIFDYAIAHWLQKSTEHILGSVLCCPGCFSIFRCSALEQCLDTFSSEVDDAVEFLTKDMGEDRWLCTLLIEKGWRLEYCAISNDKTYCPTTFDEFFKQRRRWIGSTVANIYKMITKANKITTNNESINWAFVIYQVIAFLSTIISPATVILVIASGLTVSFKVNSIAVVVVTGIVAVLYGILCVKTSQKVQINVAKALTVIFAMVMAVVIVGIIKDKTEDFLSIFHTNQTDSSVDYDFYSDSGRLLIAESSVYLALFAIVFITTAVLHFVEGFAILHSLWYLLGLPAGYLFLLIYSAANLNDRTWGTREAQNVIDQSTYLRLKNYLLELPSKVKNYFKFKIGRQQKPEPSTMSECTLEVPKEREKEEISVVVTAQEIAEEEEIPAVKCRQHSDKVDDDWLQKWLKDNSCEHFESNFIKEGYTNQSLVAEMTKEDFKEIGIKPTGYVHRLYKAAQKLPRTFIAAGLPTSVKQWISQFLSLNDSEECYVCKFEKAGYSDRDIENLALITSDELKNTIGVKKKAHLKRFTNGIKLLKVVDKDETKLAEVVKFLKQIHVGCKSLHPEEESFWQGLADGILKPTPEHLTKASELRNDLKLLRNYTLIALLIVNIMWLILLSIFTFNELEQVGLTASILSLLFLAAYGIIITVQFFAMIFHRVVTLSHYIARLNQNMPVENDNESTQVRSVEDDGKHQAQS